MSTPELAWFKSSYSGSEGDNCVEVAADAASVHVRDSKDKQGPHFTFSAQEWTHFVAFARAQR
jgi:hypothetical protein